MPDPCDSSSQRPDRAAADSTTPAPEALRRRVLARVHAEPEPVGQLAAHRARRLLGGHPRRAAVIAIALIVGAAGASALGLLLAETGSQPAGSASALRAGSVRASLLRDADRAELRLAGMPQPPIGEVYEIWLTEPGAGPRPTNALFTPTSAGTADVEVPGSLDGVSAITVTAEPRGGSSRPTSPVLLRVGLSGRAGA
jgi:anti-sigma-K factor RskA